MLRRSVRDLNTGQITQFPSDAFDVVVGELENMLIGMKTYTIELFFIR
jgi:hypothetical protein